MSGHWDPVVAVHRCDTPDDAEIRASGKKVGDVWQCDVCGLRWAVHLLDGGMREPDVHDYYMRRVTLP